LPKSPGLHRIAPFVALACALAVALAGWLVSGWALGAGGGLFAPGAPVGVPPVGFAQLTRARVVRAAAPFFIVAGAHALAGLATRWLPPAWGAARVTWLVTLIAFLLAALLSAPVAAGGLIVFAAIALGPLAIGWSLAWGIARARAR
jgi:hypothetical protein